MESTKIAHRSYTNPAFLKGIVIRLIQYNDKANFNNQGNIYAKYMTVILCARILRKDLNFKELNLTWHKYNQARKINDVKKIQEYAIQLENSITTNFNYVIEFQKEYENVNINDDSKKDCWNSMYIGILSSDEF